MKRGNIVACKRGAIITLTIRQCAERGGNNYEETENHDRYLLSNRSPAAAVTITAVVVSALS